MADFLEEKKREIASRLKELRPLVDEFHRLEAAQRALEGVGATGGSATSTPRRRRASGGTGRGRGRPRGSGNRAQQALKLVTDNPGITIPDMAQRMGIQVNYLYRVLPNLEQDGKVRKEGRGWYPKGS
jgi:predicted Rossmann fold nucleotide-binding protein DprA/Smf involved in DNA uptake